MVRVREVISPRVHRRVWSSVPGTLDGTARSITPQVLGTEHV